MKKLLFLSLLTLNLVVGFNIATVSYAQGNEDSSNLETISPQKFLSEDNAQVSANETRDVNAYKAIIIDKTETLKKKLGNKQSKFSSSNTLELEYKLKLNSLINESKQKLNSLAIDANSANSQARLGSINNDYYSIINNYREESLKVQEKLIVNEAELCRTRLSLIEESISTNIDFLQKLSIEKCNKEIAEFMQVVAMLKEQKNILNDMINAGDSGVIKQELINTKELVAKSKTKLILAKENCKMKLIEF